MSPEDTPPAAQEEETPENLFGVRLRKTSVGMLRLGSESETPPASPVHSLPIEPQRASFTEPQSNSKPALPRKPSELDGMVKPKRIPGTKTIFVSITPVSVSRRGLLALSFTLQGHLCLYLFYNVELKNFDKTFNLCML
jgi:hypothetical protein